jgi:hypothetical protein
MCNKTDARVECVACGYPYSEACVADAEIPLPCDIPLPWLDKHIFDEYVKMQNLLRDKKEKDDAEATLAQ